MGYLYLFTDYFKSDSHSATWAICTRVAPSYRRRRLAATIRNSVIVIQQVCVLHAPLTPWHLHWRRICLRTAYKQPPAATVTPHEAASPVFENTYFSLFSDFEKKHDFLRFLK